MKPYFSIAELAKLLSDDYARLADALVACGVPLIYEGKPADISRWERIQPERRNSDGSQVAFVKTGGLGPSPNPESVVVSTDALPESWTQRIKASVGAEEEFPERYYREAPDPMPKSRLVSIDGILKGIEKLSKGQLTMHEITDALNRAMDGDVMIYDGSWKGLCPAIDGFPYDEYSGFNKRQDIITDLFNSKYWERQDCVFKGYDGKIDVGDYLVLRDEAAIIARRLWWFFFPNSGIDTDSALGLKANPVPDGIQATPSTDPSLECAIYPPAIQGQTFDRLQRVIAAFPTRYPEYKSKPPKLDDDVRPWLKESGLGENDAERRVFGAIIREHFKLSPDTLKSQ